jgi:hypothetical protein
MNETQAPTLAHWLRRIQIEWDLDAVALSKITHTELSVMAHYLAQSGEALDALPTIPEGLFSAAPLVSIYKNLVRTMPNTDQQKEWLVTDNETYEGNKPIDVMAMSPAHLAWVSYTLESLRGLT